MNKQLRKIKNEKIAHSTENTFIFLVSEKLKELNLKDVYRSVWWAVGFNAVMSLKKCSTTHSFILQRVHISVLYPSPPHFPQNKMLLPAVALG